jgi:DNA-directed RNA polymerase subunit RPC12/RpoP
MSDDIECLKCGTDLEAYNYELYGWIRYCPSCGKKLLKKQVERLHKKVTDGEVSGMIKGHLLDMFACYEGGGISADEFGYKAWERENCDGVVFYSDYKADRFAGRHADWLALARDYMTDNFGSVNEANSNASCNDSLLVSAFIFATEHYVFDLLNVEQDEGNLSKTRIKEIVRSIKSTDYDGEFS